VQDLLDRLGKQRNVEREESCFRRNYPWKAEGLKDMMMQTQHDLSKLLQMVGAAEKTEDSKFEEQRSNWQKMNKLLGMIDRDLKQQKKLEGSLL
jgi:hypothetical protein